jgi:TatD DNase family protein
MMLVDVHAHPDFDDYKEDLDSFMLEQKRSGVAAIIANGVNSESNRKVLDLAKKYDIIRPALGIYPVWTVDLSRDDFDRELGFISKQDIAAIGEVGLDYFKGDDNPHGDTHKTRMKECFQGFIELAERKKLPIIVHTRRAELDVVEMLESSRLKKVVMHCFMGRRNLVKKIIDNGWSLSIPCIVGKLQQLQENVALAPMTQLFTETDAPYLSPYPETRRNEPRFVIETIKKIAEIKKLDPEEVSMMIYQNYQKMF